MDTPHPEHLSDRQASALWAEIDRRGHGRCACGLAGFAKSISQTRPQPIEPGGSFPVTVSDLASTGVRLSAPHELGVGDVLELTVEGPTGGQPLSRRGRVVWSGQTPGEQWAAGVEFVAD